MPIGHCGSVQSFSEVPPLSWAPRIRTYPTETSISKCYSLIVVVARYFHTFLLSEEISWLDVLQDIFVWCLLFGDLIYFSNLKRYSTLFKTNYL